MISNYTNLPSKLVMVESFKTMQYTQCLSFIYILCIRLLLANGIVLSMVLSGDISLWHVAPFLVCNRAASHPILDTFASRYRGFFYHRTSCIHHLLLVILPYHIESGKMHSMSIMFCLTSALVMVHIHQQYWEKIYLSNQLFQEKLGVLSYLGGVISISALRVCGSGFTPCHNMISSKRGVNVHLK